MRTWKPVLAALLAATLAPSPGCGGSASPAGAAPPIIPGPGGGGGPSGAFVASTVAAVYTSDDDLDGNHELYAASADGRQLNLSHELGDGHHVSGFALSPDEAHVAFLAGGMLHVVPTNDDLPWPVSLLTETVLEFAWAPDGQRLVYRAEASPAQVFLVEVSGANHRNLSGILGEVFTRLRWSPDGTWISYISDKEGVGALYLVRPDGTGEVRISSSAAAAGTFRFPHYSWAPSGNCIAFRADTDVAAVFELWVSADGAPAARVSTETGTTGSVGPDGWKWSPGGTRLAYRRTDAQTGELALFVVSKAGGDARKVSGSPHAVSSFQWCADSNLVYLDGGTLHVTDLDGNARELASAPVIRGVECAPDGSFVGFLVSDSPLGPFALFVANLGVDPPVVTQVSDADAEVTTFAWGAGGASLQQTQPTGPIAYYDEGTPAARSLLCRPLPGGDRTPLTRLPAANIVESISVKRDRVYFHYRHFHDAAFFDELQIFGDGFTLTPTQLGPNAKLQPLSEAERRLLQSIRGAKSLRSTTWTRFGTTGPAFPNLMFQSAATGGHRFQIQLHPTAGNQLSVENPRARVERVADPSAPAECFVIDLAEVDFSGVFRIDFFLFLGSYVPDPAMPAEGFDIAPDETDALTATVTGATFARKRPALDEPGVGEIITINTELTVHARTSDREWYLIDGDCERVWFPAANLSLSGDDSRLPFAEADFFFDR